MQFACIQLSFTSLRILPAQLDGFRCLHISAKNLEKLQGTIMRTWPLMVDGGIFPEQGKVWYRPTKPPHIEYRQGCYG
jgi:hypothetical protein